MNDPTAKLRLSALALCAGTALLCGAAQAAGSTPAPRTAADIEARYHADVERCKTGQTGQDTATCLREAGAVRQDALRHGGQSASQNAAGANASQRCLSLPAAQRQDCLTQMSGSANTTIEGSVKSGGILRRTEITVPGTPTVLPGQTTIITPEVADPSVSDLPRASAVQ